MPGLAEEVAIQPVCRRPRLGVEGETIFGRNKSGASASAKQAPVLASAPSMSPRRIKELATRLKPFVERARLQGLPSDREGLDFIASLFGFESYQSACAMPGPFALGIGTRGKGRKEEKVRISSQELLGGALVLGSTGAGKTDALRTLALAALEASEGLGLLWVDGKADVWLMQRMLCHLRELGREHDARVLNLLGGRLLGEQGASSPTHRFDPMFGFGAASIARWLENALGDALVQVGPARDLGDPQEARELMRALLACWALDAKEAQSDPSQEPGLAALARAARFDPRLEAPREGPLAKAWRSRLGLLLEHPQARLAAKAMKARAMEPIEAMLGFYGHAFGCGRDESGAWLEPQILKSANPSGRAAVGDGVLCGAAGVGEEPAPIGRLGPLGVLLVSRGVRLGRGAGGPAGVGGA